MKVGALSKKSFELVFLSLVSYTSHGVSQVHFQSLKILIASLNVVDSHFDLNVIFVSCICAPEERSREKLRFFTFLSNGYFNDYHNFNDYQKKRWRHTSRWSQSHAVSHSCLTPLSSCAGFLAHRP